MPDYTSRTFKIKRDQITPGKNDRTIFNPAELQALADNIATNGLLQPIMVRSVGPDQYEIILGERRYRACSLLGWDKIPCIVRDVTEEEASAGTPREIMAAHISFWHAAGDTWAALGRSFKRQECIAAARALETVLALI